ncbi:tetratricopeptide repeat protein [Shewanella sp. NIFS-20-20]|uniref:tetratricopeptide repeat protein n=1 Tax=Shewanella sp. NIFS-20-20 TaxID=2853806 RepID=UPI001C46208F|nr:tetratricopeptide repeat protein [Shewanella sp. NIFS-20-20]
MKLPLIIWIWIGWLTLCTQSYANTTGYSDCLDPELANNQRLSSCDRLVAEHEQDHRHSAQIFDIQLQRLVIYTSEGQYDLANQINALLANWESDILPNQEFSFLHHSGILHYRQGEYPQALAIFNHALELAKGIDDPLLIAKALSDIGTANMAMENHQQAISAFHQSLMIKQQHASPNSLAVTLNNLGSVYLKMEDWAQAEHFYSLALAIYQEHQHAARQAHTQENLAIVHMKQANYSQALAELTASLTYAVEQQNEVGQLRLLIHLAQLSLQSSQWHQASRYIERAKILEHKRPQSALTAPLKLVMG